MTSASPSESALAAATLIQTRQTVLPKYQVEPGPQGMALEMILAAAGHAPDHRQVRPWRLIRVAEAARPALGEVFAQALLARDAQASDIEQAQARDKALRSPLLLLAVVDATKGDAQISLNERVISAGCALQNMMLMATALGFASSLTTGKALHDAGLRQLFGLAAGEQALCFLSIGSAASRRPFKPRPSPSEYLSVLDADGLRPHP